MLYDLPHLLQWRLSRLVVKHTDETEKEVALMRGRRRRRRRRGGEERERSGGRGMVRLMGCSSEEAGVSGE